MASNATVIANGLRLDFLVGNAGANDPFLALDPTTGSPTQYTSIPVNRIAPQTPNRAAGFGPTGFLVASGTSLVELGYVTGVTSAIQTQLNGKQAIISATPNRAIISDGGGLLAAATTTATEIGYVNGVTSSIQTQLNSKQATITGGATTIVSANLTVNRALVSDVSGKVAVSAVTSTELGYSAGVTSAIQTQINGKLTVIVTAPASGDVITYNGSNWVNSASAAQGVPVGGTAGQYLNKINSTNYNTQWSTLTVAKITDITASAAELNLLDGVTTSTVQLNYINTVTGDVQSQLNGKLSNTLAYNSLFVGNISNVAIQLGPGTSGYVLTSVSGVPTWQPAPGAGGGIAGPGSSTDNAIVRWDGVLGTVVQDSSVTVSDAGLIAGGTWNGNLIAGQYGGTGVANTGKTITLGGNFVTSGAFATTLTVTGTTNVTLPTSGTLISTSYFANGNGTTWNSGTHAYDLGGTLTADVNFVGSFNFLIGDTTPVNTFFAQTNGGGSLYMNFNGNATWIQPDGFDLSGGDFNFDGAFNFNIGQSTPIINLNVNSSYISFDASQVSFTSLSAPDPAQFVMNSAVSSYITAQVSTGPSSSAFWRILGTGSLPSSDGLTFVSNNIKYLQITNAGAIKLTPSAGAPSVGNGFHATNIDGTGVWSALNIAGGSAYVSGVLPLANGGTGSNLSDPAANRLWGWDDTDNSIGFWTIGANLTYDHATHTLSASGGGGGGGITNSAANLELMMSNGTNAVPSGIFADAAGNLNLGTGLAGSQRVISPTGSATDIALIFASKGAGTMVFQGNSITIGATSYITIAVGDVVIQGNTSTGSGNAGGSVRLISGAGLTGNADSGHIFLETGAKAGTGKVGSISIFRNGADYGGGEKVVFWGDATTNPTTNPTGGGIMFVKSSDHNPYWRTPAGVETIMLNTGGSSWSLASGGTLSNSNTITGTTVNTLKYVFNSLGTTVTDGAGAWYANTTAATIGAQQISPIITLEGQGFATTPVASQSVKWAIYNQPVQAAANPASNLVFASNINGAGYVTRLTMSSAGILSINTLSTVATNGTLGVRSQHTTGTGVGVQVSNGAVNFTATSGTVSHFGVGLTGESFAPTSGTAAWNSILINQTINQTGGANGQIIGIKYGVTFTAAVNVTGIDYDPVTPSNISGTHLSFRATSGSVLIGGTTLTTSAILDLQSTTRAFIPPRMTTTQRDAIGTPSIGMVIYNSTTNALNLYTSSWGAIGGGAGISNTAANNEMMKSDGTNAVPSGIFSGSSGNITTGVWLGTIVAGQYGGTGVNNAGKTITLGGNLTTSGAFNTTFTVTGSNTITFPNASITVARIDAAQTFTGVNTFSSAPRLTTSSVAGQVWTSSDTLGNGGWATGGGGGGNPFADNIALIKNDADNTKLIIISAASISTGTTRTWTMPNYNGTFARIDGTNTFTGVQTFSSTPVFSAGLGSATATTQAANDNSTRVATTAYVDALTQPAFTTTLDGFVLASGSATKYLRGDNTFQTINSAAANELMKSDGSVATPSGLFSTTSGDLTLGTGLGTSTRTITATGTGNAELVFVTKGGGSKFFFNTTVGTTTLDAAGASTAMVINGGSTGVVTLGGNATKAGLSIYGGTTTIDISSPSSYHLRTYSSGTSGVASGNVSIFTGDVASGNANSGNILLDTGTKSGSGTVGNISIFSLTGSFGTGEKVIFVGNSTTAPSTNPSAGGLLYAEAGALKWRGSSGTITTLGPA